jgi:hypothetical protein
MGDELEHPIAQIEKNSRETLKVTLQTFKGYRLVAARVWVKNDSGETPTKSGLNIRVEQLRPFRDALSSALEKACDLGWIEEGKP